MNMKSAVIFLRRKRWNTADLYKEPGSRISVVKHKKLVLSLQ